MRIRSFIIAYALVLAILLFADRRPSAVSPDRYSHVVDLTRVPADDARAPGAKMTGAHSGPDSKSRTLIVAPDALIPGTWTAGQIPPERLIAPLVVIDLNISPVTASQITLDDIAEWETQHGLVPQGAIVAIRGSSVGRALSFDKLPISSDAARFLMDARYTTGFAIENPADFTGDRTLARQIALHGNYVVEGTLRLTGLPATGSLIIVAPEKSKTTGRTPVRVLAMVK
jgi:kynurenine formamidase